MIQNPLKLRRCQIARKLAVRGFLLKRWNVPLKVATPSHSAVLEVKKRLGRVRFSSFFADTESEKRRSSQTVRGNMTSSFAIQMRREPLLLICFFLLLFPPLSLPKLNFWMKDCDKSPHGFEPIFFLWTWAGLGSIFFCRLEPGGSELIFFISQFRAGSDLIFILSFTVSIPQFLLQN